MTDRAVTEFVALPDPPDIAAKNPIHAAGAKAYGYERAIVAGLSSYGWAAAAVVELIGATTTKTGLTIDCVLDERTYEKGIRVRDDEMDALDITGDAFHPEWNYTIKPRRPAQS